MSGAQISSNHPADKQEQQDQPLSAAPTILLFGMPRSGTTWLGKLFDSHPGVLYRHEPDTVYSLDPLPHFVNGSAQPGDAEQVTAYGQRLWQLSHPRIDGKQPFFSKNYQSLLHQWRFRGQLYADKVLGRLNSDWSLPSPQPVSRPARVDALVWKSIESLARLPYLCQQLPNSRGIHIIRHPCGYIGSVLRGESRKVFTGGGLSSEDYGQFQLLLNTEVAQRYGLTLEGLKQLTPVQRLAWRWLVYNEFTLQQGKMLTNYRFVRYEDVCQAPEQKTMELFHFAGLGWNAQTQAFIDASTHKEQSAYYSVYKDPAKAAFKWRKEVPAESVQQVAAVIERSELLWPLYRDLF